MTTALVNGIELYFERAGNGPRTLFLNGSGSSLASTGFLVAPFVEHLDVLAFDQRGMGLSDVPAGSWTMADYAADALALLDHLGWEECRVVGISFGGMVAQELAVTRPERVTRLALLCTSSGGEGGASYPLHALAAMTPDERLATRRSILDTRFDETWLSEHPFDRMIDETWAARGEAPRSERDQRGELAQMDARRHHDVWERLRQIACPTLVACGRYDGIAPLANSEAIARRIPGAELRVYEGGHAFFMQDRSALPAVIEFLRTS
ncbi:MAG TPA: alpha/beta hydrolase [Polyangiaceae bacterium]|jgi:pimeloyl-ACP methyl ester carboxylesterase|nr:alpha/beta hydrolase [Polyangiaceae bacterium]